MIPDGGLISTFAGKMIVVLILLIIGFVACVALSLAVMVRKAPPLTTQVNRTTGVKDHGLMWWGLFFASFTMGPPILLGIVLTSMAAVDWLNLNLPLWWLVASLAAFTALCVVVYRKVRRMQDRAYEPPVIVAAPEPVVPEMWTAPLGFEQWDR